MIPRLLLLLLFAPSVAWAQQSETYHYWQQSEATIWRGVKTMMMCNGLFTSNRYPKLIREQEWAYTRNRPGVYENDEFRIERDNKLVTLVAREGAPAMKSVYRKGLGCIIMAPGQDDGEADHYPVLETPPLAGDPKMIPWPNGDLISEVPNLTNIDTVALQAASNWAFDRPSGRQRTISLLIVHDGEIIHERYADGVDYLTKTRTWSTAKSIFVTLVGIMVDRGKMALDEPLGIEWLPPVRSDSPDPREEITLRHVLNMSSGLYPVDNGLEYATGSGLAYWAGASSANGARKRALIREPGSNWDYENYDTLLGVLAMKTAIGDDQAYLEFPRKELFDKIGMRNTVPGVDRFGDFIFSSQVYMNTRDLARLGLLYLNNGVWDGERILSEEWIDFVRTPAPSTSERGNYYGGQWWLVPDGRDDVPAGAYYTNGNRGQYMIVVPSHNLVIVRRGLDFGRQGFNPLDLMREVLKAIRHN